MIGRQALSICVFLAAIVVLVAWTALGQERLPAPSDDETKQEVGSLVDKSGEINEQLRRRLLDGWIMGGKDKNAVYVELRKDKPNVAKLKQFAQEGKLLAVEGNSVIFADQTLTCKRRRATAEDIIRTICNSTQNMLRDLEDRHFNPIKTKLGEHEENYLKPIKKKVEAK